MKRNSLKYFFILVFLLILFLKFKLPDFKKENAKRSKSTIDIIDSNSNYVWSNTPDVTLMCRIYSESVMEFYNMFIISFLLFWPYRSWTNSKLVVVLDNESERDHRFGTILANLPPYPEIRFEDYKSNTFCSNWRREGYSRQQYSNFFSDIYTQSQFIGIVDSDAFFATPITPENLFVDGKPRIYGYNGCCTNWHESLNETIGGYAIGEFMISTGFPVMIKREHFAACREHIKSRMNVTTFEEAFKKICTKYPLKYSQFDLLVHYLWHFKRNEYSWHINSGPGVLKEGQFKRLMTNRSEVLEKDKPIFAVMKHANYGDHVKYSSKLFELIYDYVCVGSGMEAGDCVKYEKKSIKEAVVRNLFVDLTLETAFWKERGMPSHGKMGEMQETPWSTKDVTYLEAYQDHKENLRKRNVDNVWKWRKIS